MSGLRSPARGAAMAPGTDWRGPARLRIGAGPRRNKSRCLPLLRRDDNRSRGRSRGGGRSGCRGRAARKPIDGVVRLPPFPSGLPAPALQTVGERLHGRVGR
ncbi:hypothetical protein [Azospirillum palustre]